MARSTHRVTRLAGRMAHWRRVNPAVRFTVDRLPESYRQRARDRMWPSGWVTGEGHGIRIRLWTPGDDSVAHGIYVGGLAAYEPDHLPVAIALARHARVIFDVGANVGAYALAMAAANPDAAVYAFEAAPVTYQRLACNADGNALGNLTCVNVAVGRGSDPLPIFSPVAGISTMSSSEVDDVGDRPWREDKPGAYRCDYVPQTRLDDFARAASIAGPVDLVKIDVERAELAVIDGMGELLGQATHVICEVLPEEIMGGDRTRALDEVVTASGLSVYLLTDDGLVPRSRVVGDSRSWNQLFTRVAAAELPTLTGRPVLAPSTLA